MSRLLIYTKDVQRITGKGRTAAQKLIARVKEMFNKNRHQQITIEEFCAHTNMSIDLVLAQLD